LVARGAKNFGGKTMLRQSRADENVRVKHDARRLTHDTRE
jgi:hypothetical protein